MLDDCEIFTADMAAPSFAEMGLSGGLPKYRAVGLAVENPLPTLSLVTSHVKNVESFPRSSDYCSPDQLSSSISFDCLLLLPSPTSSAHRCREKPAFATSNTSFHTNEGNFETVQQKIETALSLLDEYDWSFISEDSMWKVIYFHGSNLREIYINCYWDSKAKDHFIEIKRIRGDDICSNYSEFLYKLQAPFPNTTSAGSSESKRSAPSSSGTGGRLRNALPFPAVMKTGLGGSVPMIVPEVTAEAFLSGIKPILSLAISPFYEPRLEAAKMLCDLATKEKKYLELVECQELCMKALDVLLLDEFEEVRQFAVMAFASFVELDCYKKHCLQLRGLDSLLHLIRNSPREVPSYLTAQMRRKAALGMSLLARSYPKEIGEHLMKNVGYSSEQSWLDHCATILDKRTRDAAMELKRCYQV